MKRMLDLGCGERFRPDWTNVDLNPSAPGVLAYDLNRRLPFQDNTFDVVYHSHVLEHFSRADGVKFLKECHRVCRPGGIIRVVVPDLERIARCYLEYLERASSGELEASHRYDWVMLEMYDQTVRTQTGGEMAVFLRNAPPELAEFLASRVGNHLNSVSPNHAERWRSLKLAKNPKRMWHYIHKAITYGTMTFLWGRKGLEIADEILFRMHGEVHRSMYDRYSLRRALEQAAFSEATVCLAHESRIAGWSAFALDTEPDGTVYKPDSLYMEAIK